MAPDTPQPIYIFGATIFPDCPTCCVLATIPLSVTGLVAPTAPPSTLASSSTSFIPSSLPIPLPQVTITSASSRFTDSAISVTLSFITVYKSFTSKFSFIISQGTSSISLDTLVLLIIANLVFSVFKVTSLNTAPP